MYVDYHVHTEFSNDCNVPMQEQCQAAIRAGVQQIAFTEHEENNPKETLPFSFDHPAYLHELARCRQELGAQLTIRAAIEISEPHRYADAAERVLSRYPWDFVLASLHWFDADTNTNAREFFTRFGDWRESFRAYFREMLVMAQRGDFDVLAHLDYPARYAGRFIDGEYSIALYEPEIRPVLQALIERGKGLEINSGGLRKQLPAACPPQIVVNWYREMGGQYLTVGSDAHLARDVGEGIDVALRMARAAGFTAVTVYAQRCPTLLPIVGV
ncbi:MAG TPA: histidinol-phosphatase HisJ family protein [Anaerolineae bacterium]